MTDRWRIGWIGLGRVMRGCGRVGMAFRSDCVAGHGGFERPWRRSCWGDGCASLSVVAVRDVTWRACRVRARTARPAPGAVWQAQDTTEITFRASRRGLGPGGDGKSADFFIHAVAAVDAEDEAVLGMAGGTQGGPALDGGRADSGRAVGDGLAGCGGGRSGGLYLQPLRAASAGGGLAGAGQARPGPGGRWENVCTGGGGRSTPRPWLGWRRAGRVTRVGGREWRSVRTGIRWLDRPAPRRPSGECRIKPLSHNGLHGQKMETF